MKKKPIYVFEGAWDSPSEAPQVLPYFQAYAQTFRTIELNHRTFRCAEDLKYYFSKLPKNGRAFVYVACHGDQGVLLPSDAKSEISREEVNDALRIAKPGSIGFLHFASCDFVKSPDANRRKILQAHLENAQAVWVSGYSKGIDWLPSMLVDLALVHEIFVQWHQEPTKLARHKKRLQTFQMNYESVARGLGLSCLYHIGSEAVLFPKKVSLAE